MALNIKNRETERLARELAKRTHLSITDAIHWAVRDKLQAFEADVAARRARLTPTQQKKLRRLETISRKAAGLSVLDTRTDEEILGYDDRGALK